MSATWSISNHYCKGLFFSPIYLTRYFGPDITGLFFRILFWANISGPELETNAPGHVPGPGEWFSNRNSSVKIDRFPGNGMGTETKKLKSKSVHRQKTFFLGWEFKSRTRVQLQDEAKGILRTTYSQLETRDNFSHIFPWFFRHTRSMVRPVIILAFTIYHWGRHSMHFYFLTIM